jgi:hypothetical protein
MQILSNSIHLEEEVAEEIEIIMIKEIEDRRDHQVKKEISKDKKGRGHSLKK